VPGHHNPAVTITAIVTALRKVSVVEVAAQEVRQEMGEANPLVRKSQRPTGMDKIQIHIPKVSN